MRTSLIVIDHFLDNIDKVRAAALRMTYRADPQAAYAGRNSREQLDIQGLQRVIARRVGEALQPMPPPDAHGKCRLTLASEQGRSRVHIDPGVHWAGVLYLNRPEDCRGGTDFFRHVPTQTDHAPLDARQLADMGYASKDDMYGEILGQHSNDASKWERSMCIPMRYNRLALYRPWLWHAAGDGFGDAVDNGRLVYLLFFGRAEPSVARETVAS